MSSGKTIIIPLIAEQIKKISSFNTNYYLEPDSYARSKIKIELDLSEYVVDAIESDVKKSAGIDTSELLNKDDLASLKSEVDKLDFDKLKIVPTDVSKLRNAVDNNVVKKSVYDELLKKSMLLMLLMLMNQLSTNKF